MLSELWLAKISIYFVKIMLNVLKRNGKQLIICILANFLLISHPIMKLLSIQFRLLLRWLRYFWRAKTIYDVHSPFVADLVNAVLEDTRHFYAFSEIEGMRRQLLESKKEARIEDYGAGSKVNKSNSRTIGNITRYSAISPRVGQWLFRLAHFRKPQTILELGTSLGISTMYLTSGALNAKAVTLEGCSDIAKQAQRNFTFLNKINIESREGIFEDLLPTALSDLQKVDLLFLDGDHRAGASLRYFEQCLAYAHEQSVFVIADIHWSEEMETAWKQLKLHPRVSLSIDLFYIGLLFFRTENKQPEHYTLIERKYKFWRWGIFG